ncbi:MAG: hypothetical protein KIG78_00955, partial [Bacteroidaceae bacterium]|nr:hypothetical protein [Bacteroidaceae bacterium]
MHHSDDKDKHNNRNQEKISKEINKKPDDSPDFHISSNYSTDKKGEEGKKKKSEGFLASLQGTPSLKKAATYSPALRCSTIGAPGLNFSVRD